MPDLANLPGLEELIARMTARSAAPALHGDAGELTYAELLSASDRWVETLEAQGVAAGTVCGYVGDFSPDSIALFIALMRLRAVAVPLTQHAERDLERFAEIAGLERLIRFGQEGARLSDFGATAANPLIEKFRGLGHPGLVVFTSGSTGRPKGILHDLERVLGKFASERLGWRTIMFLMMDHFGGVNTLLSTLAYGGVAICVEQRSPEAVCRAIDRGRAELLPTTPTFLNMIIASGASRHHDLSTLRLITYGTEPMPEATLRRICEVFPQAVLKQTYGLSELGVLHSQSPDPGSLWLRIGGKGFETRVVDGMLHIRSASSMVGYLNAPSPIDSDGWMNTGDVVEEQDGLIRFVGRASEVINVGGQKVFPMEVESVLLEASNVTEATVFGVRHPLLGQAVRALVSLAEPEAEDALADRLKDHCRARLAKYKVPLRFDVADPESHVSERAKKRRFATGHAEPQDA
jgi:long-chain acyl-CoA synthetase